MQVNTELLYEATLFFDEIIKMGNLLNYFALSGLWKGG